MRLKSDKEYIHECMVRALHELRELNEWRPFPESIRAEYLYKLGVWVLIKGAQLIDCSIKLEQNLREQREGRPMNEYFKKQLEIDEPTTK